jgi:hypothetical protein
MTDLICTFIHVPYLPTGRRLYALKQCMGKVAPTGEDAIKALIEEALAHDWGAAESGVAWARSRNLPKARGESAAVNDQVNAVYSSMYSTLGNHLSALPSDHPISIAARTILGQIFPEGLKPIVFLSFENQLSMSEIVLARFKGEPEKGDLHEAAAVSGITSYVEQLGELNDKFRDELEKFARKETSYDVIEAAESRGNRFMKRLVALIIGTYHQETKEAEERRNTLLGPINEQCERMRQGRKGRRPAQDVDPETGDEITPTQASA